MRIPNYGRRKDSGSGVRRRRSGGGSDDDVGSSDRSASTPPLVVTFTDGIAKIVTKEERARQRKAGLRSVVTEIFFA